MRTWKKMLASAMAAVLVATSGSLAFAEELPLATGSVHITEGLADGVYASVATVGEGVEGLPFLPYDLQVSVTVSGGAVESISYAGGSEQDASYNAAAHQQIFAKLQGQRAGEYGIDAVSGATYSGQAFTKALDQALTQNGIGVPKIKKAEIVSKGIKLKWKAVEGAERYDVYRNGTKVQTVSGTSCIDKKAKKNGKKYTYRVVAWKGETSSAKSEPKTCCYISSTSINNVLNGSKGSRSLIITWNENKKADGYQLQYSLRKNFSGAKKTTAPGKTSVIAFLKNLQAYKTYYVRVRAYKKVGGTKYYSVWSGRKQGTVRAY